MWVCAISVILGDRSPIGNSLEDFALVGEDAPKEGGTASTDTNELLKYWDSGSDGEMRDALPDSGDQDMCHFISYKEAIARGLTTAHKVGSVIERFTLESFLTDFSLYR